MTIGWGYYTCDKCQGLADGLHCADCMDDVCAKCAAVYDNEEPPGYAVCKECDAIAKEIKA